MLSLHNASIKVKLNLLVLFTTSAALVLAAVLLAINDTNSFRQSLAKDITTLARVVGYNSASALDFGGKADATNTLAALEARPSIRAAALFDKDGDLFAMYTPPSRKGVETEPALRPDGAYFEDGRLMVFAPVVKEGRMGTIYIESGMGDITARLKRNSLIVAFIMILVSLVVFLASSKFQRAISQPILDLAQTARIVSEEKNYTIRAEKRTHDEIGFLIDRFNEMLAQIQKRETELRALNHDLALSEKRALAATQAKSQFLATMSHELRTPMNAIIGFSEVLLDPEMPVDEGTRKQFLENILNAGRHLLSLINDILDLSKVEAGKMELHPEDFDIAACLEGIYSVVRPLAQKKNQTLELVVRDGVGLAYHDASRFKQALFNLLSNAIKFTPEGGRVSTSVQATPDGWLSLAVTDTGIGIREEDLPTLFEEFKQIDSGYARQQQGTGLGLALVKRMVNLMGGEVQVQSKPGQGSTFTVRIPLRQPEFSCSEFAGGEADHGKSLVLVVEDDQPSASLMSFHLARDGYRVECATTASEALEKCKRLKPEVVTLDIILPKEDGWHVLKQLKRDSETSEIPVVVISVVDDPVTAREAGASAHLTKPLDVKLLLATLGKLRKGGFNGG